MTLRDGRHRKTTRTTTVDGLAVETALMISSIDPHAGRAWGWSPPRFALLTRKREPAATAFPTLLRHGRNSDSSSGAATELGPMYSPSSCAS